MNDYTFTYDATPGASAAVSNSSMANPEEWLFEALGSQKTLSGVRVTQQTSLSLSSVWACCRIRAEGLATLPLKLFERTVTKTGEPGRTERPDLPNYGLLHDMPHPRWDAYSWREFEQLNLDLWGNAFARIMRDGAGRVRELVPWHASQVKAQKDKSGRMQYVVDDGYRKEHRNPDNVFHVKQFPLADFGFGLSTIAYHRQRIGMSVAQVDHGAAFFGNDSTPGGVLVNEGRMNRDQKAEQARSWRENHAGAKNSRKIAVLDQSTRFQPISMPNRDAEWLDAMKFGVADIARIFQVPSPLINDLEFSADRKVEQLSLIWKVYGLRPLTKRWENACNTQLLVPSQKRVLFWEFVLEDLLSADLEAKAAFVEKLVFHGFITRNEGRKALGYDPIPGGDTFYVQSAMAPLDDDGHLIALGASDVGATNASVTDLVSVPRSAVKRAVMDAARRKIKVEVDRMQNAAKAGRLCEESMIAFYDEHATHFVDSLLPLQDLAGFATSTVKDAVATYCDTSQSMLQQIMDNACDVSGDVQQMTSGWAEERATELVGALV